ncbi:hypothetical protein [Salmonirosea aquatica]|uniref:DUF4129 domain-containing protein n=1 Tax=Salmonirosea aquatica TaxID=2654236 RepID=A0A7C9FDG6_9BACT|nr:hypothetical protein [Cytophagaceae bacterium SJW1-29]
MSIRCIYRFCFLIFGLLGWMAWIPGFVWAQSSVPKPVGRFLSDTIEVGKPFSYAFSYLHDSEMDVFFPDSSFDFSPFTFVDQEYFTTRTDSLGSLDSTVYRLMSFEVAAVQAIRLPVYVLAVRDCTAVFAETDTIALRSTLPVSTRLDTLSLRPETEVALLRRQFNYPVFMAFIVSAGLLFLAIYWLFGRGIIRQWRIFQLQRRHRDFIRTFARLNRTARERDSTEEAEKAVVVWKDYLEEIEKKPFATYTTREIVDNIPDDALEEALKTMDRIIYGQVKSKKMETSLQVLRNVAQRIYQRQRTEIVRAGKRELLDE